MKIYQVATDGTCRQCKTDHVKLYYTGRSQKDADKASNFGGGKYGFCNQCMIEQLMAAQERYDILAVIELMHTLKAISDKYQIDLRKAWDKYQAAIYANNRED